MSLRHLFVPLEIAKVLKEKGFNEECFYHWSTVPEGYTDEPRLLDNGGYGKKNKNDELNHLQISAPTYQQVQDWFREVYELEVGVELKSHSNYYSIVYNFSDYKEGVKSEFTFSYYEALQVSINKAITII